MTTMRKRMTNAIITSVDVFNVDFPIVVVVVVVVVVIVDVVGVVVLVVIVLVVVIVTGLINPVVGDGVTVTCRDLHLGPLTIFALLLRDEDS